MAKHSLNGNESPAPSGQTQKRGSTHARIAELEAQLAESRQQEAATAARVSDLEAQLSIRRATLGNVAGERLDTLLEICSALLIIHDVESIVRLIVRAATRLFPGTSTALLFLLDRQADCLALRATSAELVPDIRLQPGQGIAGHALLSPRAMLMVGPELAKGLSSLEEDQVVQLQKVMEDWPPSSALIAPLRVETTRLGSLVLCSNTQAHLFHPRDLPFIQTLADLTAVAISEAEQRAHAASLQRDLARIHSLHEEAKARLNTAQAQLLQSAKLAAVGELAASVAHEINNPLYAARNSLYLVEQDLPADAPQRPFLDIAQNELGRIARIITRMRDFYRPTKAELAPTNVNKILMETVELVQTHLRHNQITIVQELAPDLPLSTAHADQLRQVFLNLMLNACDAMPNGGTLNLATRLLSSIDDGTPHVDIRIADTGIGIAPEHLPHLFEPFYTTKPHGTGLGLAISAHIITQHDGQIQVESTIGEGATFVITLPIIK
jgi:two-component system NtrC family sensor kinase